MRFFLITLFTILTSYKTLTAQNTDDEMGYDFIVACDGSGDFTKLQDAINAVPDFRRNMTTSIYIKKGVYKEKLIIPQTKNSLTLTGDSGTVITYDDYADKKNCFNEDKGTSGSSSVYICGSNITCRNITFENTSGAVGPAVACMIMGDRVSFINCRFLGYQDTLYTYGKKSRQYYRDCYIEGVVDFIFGASTAYFDNCTIHSKGDGFITAPSTEKDSMYGYIFNNCSFTASRGVEMVFLSRPWRSYAKAVLVNCNLEKHIMPEGWHDWGNPQNRKTAFYAEYNSTGPGANDRCRVRWSKRLKSIKGYEIGKVLEGWDPLEK